mmetsp:Transcript_43124/g.113279  ORF Transcript_43124/g.113279 Transcript_43124/m.113279 type:complete len:208 (+) Transcript_43124:1465-2088(+)
MCTHIAPFCKSTENPRGVVVGCGRIEEEPRRGLKRETDAIALRVGVRCGQRNVWNLQSAIASHIVYCIRSHRIRLGPLQTDGRLMSGSRVFNASNAVEHAIRLHNLETFDNAIAALCPCAPPPALDARSVVDLKASQDGSSVSCYTHELVRAPALLIGQFDASLDHLELRGTAATTNAPLVAKAVGRSTVPAHVRAMHSLGEFEAPI